jgi:predicted transcriptional regulator YdeE
MLRSAFTSRDAFWVLGIQERADPMSMDYQAFWSRFMAREPELRSLVTGPDGYGVYFPTDQEGLVDVFGGMAVPPETAPPEGLVLREVPAGHYAVFECTMQDIGATWAAVFGEWAPSAGHEIDHTAPCFEHFTPGCHEGTEPVRIFVPVQGQG